MELELKVTWAEMLKVLVGSLRHRTKNMMS